MLSSIPKGSYRDVLFQYFRSHDEDALYKASLLSQEFIVQGVGPEEITEIHFEAIQEIMDGDGLSPADRVRIMADAHQLLLEVMINYGVKYREYVDLKVSESVREAETRLELERQRAEEAERSEQEKTHILAAIAHELGTPVTAAKGNVDIAVTLLTTGRVEEATPVLGTARTALERLTNLTADLMAATRGEIPQIDIAPVDLGEAARQTVTWARVPADEKGVSVYCDGAPGIVEVEGNHDALLTVLGNLVSNAIRYTLPGGKVDVRIGSDQHAGWVEVADDGIGMTPEVQARIFERFYRSTDARRSSGSGLGLGLSIARQFLEGMNGEIEVSSKPGIGSRFVVRIPLARPEYSEPKTTEDKRNG